MKPFQKISGPKSLNFIIEIVSPGNPSDDYIYKLYYYKNYGTREYWIIDPRRQKVTVYCLDQADFEMEIYSFQDTIKVSICDELYIDFSEMDLSI